MAICIKKDTYPKIIFFYKNIRTFRFETLFILVWKKASLCSMIAFLYSRQKSESERIISYISLLTLEITPTHNRNYFGTYIFMWVIQHLSKTFGKGLSWEFNLIQRHPPCTQTTRPKYKKMHTKIHNQN